MQADEGENDDQSKYHSHSVFLTHQIKGFNSFVNYIIINNYFT